MQSTKNRLACDLAISLGRVPILTGLRHLRPAYLSKEHMNTHRSFFVQKYQDENGEPIEEFAGILYCFDAAIANIPLPQPMSKKLFSFILSWPINCSKELSALLSLVSSKEFSEKFSQFVPKLKAIFLLL